MIRICPFFLRIIFYFLSRLPDAFIFSSIRTKNYYSPYLLSRKNHFIIHPPVNTDYFFPKKTLGVKKNFLSKKKKKEILIGYVANINPNKNIEAIIELARRFKYKKLDVKFCIVGSCFKSQKKYYNKLLKMIYDLKLQNLYIINFKSDLRPLLNSIDIYINSSLSESGPMSLYEAMSMKKAVITSNVGDVSKLIKNGSNGYVYEHHAIDKVEKLILMLIKDKKKREKIGIAARKLVKTKLDTKIAARKHYSAYQYVNTMHEL